MWGEKSISGMVDTNGNVNKTELARASPYSANVNSWFDEKKKKKKQRTKIEESTKNKCGYSYSSASIAVIIVSLNQKIYSIPLCNVYKYKDPLNEETKSMMFIVEQ